MNKLLLKLERDFNDDIIIVANNHKDIEDYLINECKFHRVELGEQSIYIIDTTYSEREYGTLTWVKHI